MMSRKTAKPTLADNIRAERNRLRMNQSSLAAKVGITRNLLVAIETGRVFPAPELLEAIARVLGTSTNALIGQGDPQPVAA